MVAPNAEKPALLIIDMVKDNFDEDLWLPKSRFSAFFNTGLEKYLQDRDVTLCAVAGISTHFCVLTTAWMLFATILRRCCWKIARRPFPSTFTSRC